MDYKKEIVNEVYSYLVFDYSGVEIELFENCKDINKVADEDNSSILKKEEIQNDQEVKKDCKVLT